jgi:hypothetical protein
MAVSHAWTRRTPPGAPKLLLCTLDCAPLQIYRSTVVSGSKNLLLHKIEMDKMGNAGTLKRLTAKSEMQAVSRNMCVCTTLG